VTKRTVPLVSLKYKFPIEYVDVVLLFNEGHPELNHFDTLIKEGLPDGIVPFGYEITGDLLCFDFKHHPETPSIVLWKHELAPDEGDVGSQKEMGRIGLEYINDSFYEFIHSLY
jgi:hypothetical protein